MIVFFLSFLLAEGKLSFWHDKDGNFGVRGENGFDLRNKNYAEIHNGLRLVDKFWSCVYFETRKSLEDKIGVH